jgi:hypothetical protein
MLSSTPRRNSWRIRAVGKVSCQTVAEIPCKYARLQLSGECDPDRRRHLHPHGARCQHANDFRAGAHCHCTHGIPWDYRVLEFAGAALEQFKLAARVAVCNTVTEIGVANVFFPPSKDILDEARARAQRPFTPVYSDADATYEAELSIDLDRLAPQVVLPGAPDRAADIARRSPCRVRRGHRACAGYWRPSKRSGQPRFLRRRTPDPAIDTFQRRDAGPVFPGA